MYNFFLTLFFILVFGSGEAMAFQESMFEPHFYMRSGIGSSSKGGDQICFANPGAGSNEFRLGNECGNYGELSFKINHLKRKSYQEKFFTTQFLFAYNTDGHENWENANNKDGIALREAYVTAGNIGESKLSFWVGNRFYRENDVYMNDFYYFADTSGNGVGVKGISFLNSLLDVAYLKQTSSQDTDKGKVALSLIDFRLRQIKLSEKNQLKFWVSHAFTSSGVAEDGKKYGDQEGQTFGVLLNSKLVGGFNHLALLYGSGVIDDFNLYFSALEIDSQSFKAEKEKSRLRLVEHLTLKLSENLEFHTASVIEQRNSGNGNEEYWYNLGFHPVYYFSESYQLTGQIGYSVVDPKNAETKRLLRLSIAPQIALSNNIWARPILRAFYSYNFWNRANKGSVGSSLYENDTSGGAWGFQAEVFF